MHKPLSVSLLLGFLMMSSAVATRVVTPSVKMADLSAKFNLETMIPAEFGDWRIDTSIVPLQVDPDTQAKLDKIYNQTLARTYVNRAGQRIMLSIAYGGDQSDNMGVHKPEICYTAQGFDVRSAAIGELATPYGKIPVKRLYAISGSRTEPITYWITIGQKVTRPGMEQRWQQLRYGLTGMVADGMLVRVSNIDSDEAASYALQKEFINAMLNALSAPARMRLVGVADI